MLHQGLRHHIPTPQGAAVVAVPSFDRHHDGGLATDSPYSTTNQINQHQIKYSVNTIDVTTMHGKYKQEIGSFIGSTAARWLVVAAVVVVWVTEARGGGWWRCMVIRRQWCGDGSGGVCSGCCHGGAGCRRWQRGCMATVGGRSCRSGYEESFRGSSENLAEKLFRWRQSAGDGGRRLERREVVFVCVLCIENEMK
nr:hypothetical protein [Tanacetum cinerariifolium]